MLAYFIRMCSLSFNEKSCQRVHWMEAHIFSEVTVTVKCGRYYAWDGIHSVGKCLIVFSFKCSLFIYCVVLFDFIVSFHCYLKYLGYCFNSHTYMLSCTVAFFVWVFGAEYRCLNPMTQPLAALLLRPDCGSTCGLRLQSQISFCTLKSQTQKQGRQISWDDLRSVSFCT